MAQYGTLTITMMLFFPDKNRNMEYTKKTRVRTVHSCTLEDAKKEAYTFVKLNPQISKSILVADWIVAPEQIDLTSMS